MVKTIFFGHKYHGTVYLVMICTWHMLSSTSTVHSKYPSEGVCHSMLCKRNLEREFIAPEQARLGVAEGSWLRMDNPPWLSSPRFPATKP